MLCSLQSQTLTSRPTDFGANRRGNLWQGDNRPWIDLKWCSWSLMLDIFSRNHPRTSWLQGFQARFGECERFLWTQLRLTSEYSELNPIKYVPVLVVWDLKSYWFFCHSTGMSFCNFHCIKTHIVQLMKSVHHTFNIFLCDDDDALSFLVFGGKVSK